MSIPNEGIAPTNVDEQASVHPPTVQPPKVGPLFIILFALAMFGVWMAILTPAAVTVAIRVAEVDPAGKETSYSLLAGVGALTAVIANPLFGRLSDRTSGGWGMRRPWAVIGLLGMVAGGLVLAYGTSVPMLLVGWVLMQLFVNAIVASMLAVIGDQVPPQQQGLVSGLAGAAAGLAVISGTYFVQLFPTQAIFQVGIPILMATVFIGLFIAQLKDRQLAAKDRPTFSLKEFVGSFYFNPREAPEFGWFLFVVFVNSAGTAVAYTYLVYFLQDSIGVAEADLLPMVFRATLVMYVANTVAALLAGWVSDRMRRRKPVFAFSGIIAAVGILTMVFGGSVLFVYVGVALVGVGLGSIYGTYISIALRVMPDANNTARDLGITNMASTLPSSLIPFAAPAVLAIGGGSNYTLLFIVGAVLAVVALPLLLKIRSVR